MNRINQLLALLILIFFTSCENKSDSLQAVQQQFNQGNFAEASTIIDALQTEVLADSIAFDIEILKAK